MLPFWTKNYYDGRNYKRKQCKIWICIFQRENKITWYVTHKGSWTFFVSSLLQWSSNFMAFTKQSFASIGNSKYFFDVVKKKTKKGTLLFVCSWCVVWLFRKLLLILSFFVLFWNGHLWHLFINMIVEVRISKRWSIDIWWHPLHSLI